MRGWFPIDFISVFPFDIFGESEVQGQHESKARSQSASKLFRLARLPRLIKLIDISRFKKLSSSLMSSNSSRDEQIVAQYMILNVYKIFRLIIIAIITTYFLGCSWFWYCTQYNHLTDRPNFIGFNDIGGEDVNEKR